MIVRVIGVPSAWGTKELGARRTPAALRDRGLLEWLGSSGLRVEDGGDVQVPPQGPDDLWDAADAGGGLIHRTEVVSMATAVREAVDRALSDGVQPLLVGGECCLSIGAVGALGRRAEAVTVAWLDAHGDINTPATSGSGLITGMPLAAVLGHGDAELLAVGAGGVRPAPDKTFLLGGRDLDPGERDNIATWGVVHLPTEATREAGPEGVALGILGPPVAAIMPPEARRAADEAPAPTDAADTGSPAGPAPAEGPVYLHIDVDAIDPSSAPGVHYRVADGFHPSEVATLAGYLCASGRVGVIALASANLDHDEEDRTIDSIRTVVTSIGDALAAVESAP